MKRALLVPGLQLSHEDWRGIGRQLRLKPRELQVLQQVAEDEHESAIARRLGISRHTVHTYLRRLFSKLGVSSRLALTVAAFRQHLARTG